MNKIKIFFSYSHKDEVYRDELERHLSVLKSEGLIQSWHDRKIGLGENFDSVIHQELMSSQIILFLISSDFISSDYCREVEVRRAIEMHEKKEAICIPIFLRECYIDNSPFSKLQGIPRDKKYILSENWFNKDAAYTTVVKELKNRISELSTDIKKNDEHKAENEEEVVGAFKVLLSKQKEINYQSTKKDIEEFYDLRSKLLDIINVGQEQIDNTPILVDSYTTTLFNQIYSSEILSPSIKSQIQNLRTSDKYFWYHRSLIVSAITISIINFKTIDQHKVLILLDFIFDNEDKVWQKALTGITISLLARKNAWLRFEAIKKKLELLRDNQIIQNSLKALAFLIEQDLYSVYFKSKKIFDIDYFKQSPANCFIPFFEKNKSIEFYFENSEDENPLETIEVLKNTPMPDMLKHYFCYASKKNTDSTSGQEKRSIFFRQIIHASKIFDPFLQQLNEIFAFINFYPSHIKNDLFSDQFSLANTKLKDYIFSEIEKHRLIANHYISKELYSDAINHYKAVLRLNESDTEALTNIANCYNQEKNYKEEINIRKELRKKDPTNIENILDLGLIYSALSKRDEAKECLRGSIKAEINNYEIDYQIGLLAFNLNEFDIAKKYFDKSLQNQGDNYKVLISRANYHGKINKFNEALEDVERAIQLKKRSSEAYSTKSRIMLTTNKFKDALSAINKAIEIKSDEADYYIERAKIYSILHDQENEMKDIENAKRLNPKNPRVIIRQVNLLADENKYDIAIDLLDAGIKKGYFLSEFLYSKALIRIQQGLNMEALKIVEEILKIDTEEPKFNTIAAKIYNNIENEEEALFFLNKAMKYDKYDVSILNDRAIYYLRHNKYNLALNDFLKAYEQNPYEKISIIGISTTYRLMQDVEKAELWLKKFKIENAEELTREDKANYYGCLAEIESDKNNDELFFENINIAKSYGFKIDSLELDIRAKYESNERFIKVFN